MKTRFVLPFSTRGSSMNSVMKVIRLRLNSRARTLSLALLCLFLLLIQPMRQLWMSLFFPRPWAEADAVHLYKVLTDYQNIRLDRAPLRRVLSYEEIPEPSFKLVDNKDVYPEFWQVKAQGDRAELVTMFEPLLNSSERHLLLSAFSVFHQACQKAGLTYFFTEASLMGVIRHHGLIPWDDDIDVAMPVKDWVRIRDVLSNIPSFELFPQAERHWKFYSRSGQHFETEYHRFPYVDIFFYDEDDTHIWAVSRYLKHDLLFRKSDIFPLQPRPFEGLLVPTPCNLDVVVHAIHDTNVCVTPAFVHKTNAHNTNDHIKVDCRRLHDMYPFVSASSPRGGEAEERLKVGKRLLHIKKVPVGCSHARKSP